MAGHRLMGSSALTSVWHLQLLHWTEERKLILDRCFLDGSLMTCKLMIDKLRHRTEILRCLVSIDV